MSLLHILVAYILRNNSDYSSMSIPVDLKEILNKLKSFNTDIQKMNYAVKHHSIPLINYYCNGQNYDTIILYAAKYNNFRLIRYYEHKTPFKRINWSSIIDGAIQSKNLEMVKYVELKEYQTGSSIYKNNPSNLVSYAAHFGNLEIIKYFVHQISHLLHTINWDFVLYGAARAGRLEIIKYCEKNISNSIDWVYALKSAAISGNVKILKYIESICFDISFINWVQWNWVLFDAIHSKNLEMVKYCRKKKANQWNLGVLIAARENNLEILKYCESICFESGHSEKIDWKDAIKFATTEGTLTIHESYLNWNWKLKGKTIAGNPVIIEYCQNKLKSSTKIK